MSKYFTKSAVISLYLCFIPFALEPIEKVGMGFAKIIDQLLISDSNVYYSNNGFLHEIEPYKSQLVEFCKTQTGKLEQECSNILKQKEDNNV